MLSLNEQETVIQFDRDNDICTIYTSDSMTMTKLDKLANDENAPIWQLVEEHYIHNGGELVGKTYKTKKGLITFRSDFKKQTLTDEQKKAYAERARKLFTCHSA